MAKECVHNEIHVDLFKNWNAEMKKTILKNIKKIKKNRHHYHKQKSTKSTSRQYQISGCSWFCPASGSTRGCKRHQSDKAEKGP